MKNFIIITIFTTLLFIQKSYSQGPIYFPTGAVFGPTTIAIPAGSNYKLAVSGGIITEKVRIAGSTTMAWADYVFEPNYKLKSIEEVAKFVKTYKHLPDVPTTKDVKQNGVDLADTQVILLQKIEEMTLYIIEQNKKIKILERKFNSIKNKNLRK